MAENGQQTGTFRVKSGMAQMLKGGVIMDVVDAEQAKVAEEAGAVAVMALERVPADIRAHGGVARMSDPEKIVEIQEAVTIPVMAKARIGHFVEARILEALEVDYVDESEVLTPADEANHVDKHAFDIPFVCGATNLGEALRRIGEGAAMIRSKGEAGTGNVVEAVRHMRAITGGIRRLTMLGSEELMAEAKNLGAPYDLVRWVSENGRLPVVLFTAGGIATPADAALMMQLGADGVFVGSGIFKSGDPASRAAAIVKATTYHGDPKVLAEASRGLGETMAGREMGDLSEGRSWQSVDGNGEARREARRVTARPEDPEGPKKIGVLALQGDSREHARILKGLGVEPVEVRAVEDLAGLAGLIVPGGESTAIGNLMVSSGLLDGIRSFFYKDGPVWGTCAGMVLAASATTGPRQPLLGLMNALVERNGFGRQVHSFEKDLDVEGFDEPFTGVFIRAPFFEDVGPGVEVLSEVDGRIVAARGENILVTAFHPELTEDARFHEYFLREVCEI